MASSLQAVRRSLEACTRPLLCSHIRLDGDAVGAELALADILRALGKTPHVVNESAVPRVFRFLPGAESVASLNALRGDYDRVVVLDANSRQRLGGLAERLPAGVPMLFIDHHPSDNHEGEVRWVDTAYSSVGEMVYALAAESGWPISPAAATALYLAITSDTGRFTLPNATPGSLRAAAALLELGADRHRVVMELYYSDPLALVHLRGQVMSTVRLACGGRVGIATVTHAMLRAHGVDPIDTQEFAEIPRLVAGVEVACLLRELADGTIKASLRSDGRMDVRDIAKVFGGGGHPQAAGCELPGPLSEAEQRVVAEIERRLASISKP